MYKRIQSLLDGSRFDHLVWQRDFCAFLHELSVQWPDSHSHCLPAGMVHHNLVVKGPLFPLFPEGWEGPQAGDLKDLNLDAISVRSAVKLWG